MAAAGYKKAAGPIFSIRRLRWAMVVAGLLLMIVLTGYIGYARYRMHKLVSGLPGRLGIPLSHAGDGDHVTILAGVAGANFVYATRGESKSAAPEIAWITLNDVGIVLYGL